MATLAAVKLAGILQSANLPPLLLLLGFVVVVAILDLIITGAIPKWAIFAPDLRAAADEAERRAGGRAGGLPGRRLARQRHHAR